ncbi:MAG: hypothetical protein GKC04_00400 [Methanomicrobiales archaeon]|nr:hypothetical protein [Methanomicrobiales archaeon]
MTILAGALICTAGCLGGLLQHAAVYPSLHRVEGAAPVPDASFSFPFQDMTVSVSVPLDAAVLAGARAADKNARVYGDPSDEAWIPGYYRSFVEDDDLDSLYAGITARLAEVRGAASLDSDEYLELMAVYVQSIPYATDADLINPKFPVETIADAEGDCDDKSLLLAGMLAREGYDVALLYFGPERHMAVGVRSPGHGYAASGYAYVEVTNVSYIGIAPDRLDGGIALSSEPVVIPIGAGTLGYGSCDETGAIHEARAQAEAAIAECEAEVAAADATLSRSYAELEALAAEIEALRRTAKVAEYNALVPVYNAKAAAYNRDRIALQPEIESYNRQVEVYNYILRHAHDRPGTVAWLAANGA